MIDEISDPLNLPTLNPPNIPISRNNFAPSADFAFNFHFGAFVENKQIRAAICRRTFDGGCRYKNNGAVAFRQTSLLIVGKNISENGQYQQTDSGIKACFFEDNLPGKEKEKQAANQQDKTHNAKYAPSVGTQKVLNRTKP